MYEYTRLEEHKETFHSHRSFSPASDAIVIRAGGREQHHHVVRPTRPLRVPREVAVDYGNDGTSGHQVLHLLFRRGPSLKS